jgi:L-alanine-DL-glutamate epimerase-like enolase superfamily enzyme
MLKACYKKHTLRFIKPGGTSRGVLTEKDSWYLIVYDDNQPEKKGIGECSILPGLSVDDRPDFEQKLAEVAHDVERHTYWLKEGLEKFPAIRFGLEAAMKDLLAETPRILFPSEFTTGKEDIPINGLIWMSSFEDMYQQIKEKTEQGFDCIKLKIGAIDFEEEMELLKRIRREFTKKDIELRVDANGAFAPEEALEKLKRLSEWKLHSIEQPIRQNQWEEMARICSLSPVPVALDEELTGICQPEKVKEMLDVIKPAYIILKPSLLGGWQQSELFIREAGKRNISWWVTSALESNIGLNAIAQWTFTLKNKMYQGLGTGQLFENNLPSPLTIREGNLHYNVNESWDVNSIIND